MSDFLMIDETLIPEGSNNDFSPLEEGSYSATCVGMISGTGTKHKSTMPESKVRFVFAIDEEDKIHFVRTNWMKVTLWDGEPTPSALWNILRAWTKQKSVDELIKKMGKFDLKFFLGKPINLVLKVTADDKYNVISDYTAPKKGQATISACELPEFYIKADKLVTADIKYVLMDGATIKVSEKDEKATPTAPAPAPAEVDDDDEADLPF